MSHSGYILNPIPVAGRIPNVAKYPRPKKHCSAYPGFRLCTHCSRSINQVVSARTIRIFLPTKYGQRRGRRLHPQPSRGVYLARKKNSPPRTLAPAYICAVVITIYGGGAVLYKVLTSGAYRGPAYSHKRVSGISSDADSSRGGAVV